MLFGTAAVAIPIIIHFLNRRKFRQVTWAAMKFVQLSVDQNQRRIRLEDLILLLLRCAILALLAFALARPAMKTSQTDVLGQAKVTAVIVLDNSYSMDLLGGDGNSTAFEQARSAAYDTLSALPTGSRVAVLLASDIVQGVIDEPTHDLTQAREVIKNASPSDHATDLYPALVKAMEVLEGRAVLRKEVYLITDGQASGWHNNADMKKLITKHQDEVNVYVLRVGGDEAQRNLAITRIDNYDGLTPVNHPLRFEVEVTNNDDEAAENVRVGLHVDGEAAAVDSITVPNIPARAAASVTLYANLKQPGYHEIEARFPNPQSTDNLAKDNINRLIVKAVEQVNVLLVHNEDSATDIAGDDRHEGFFLNLALAPRDDHYVKVVSKPVGEMLDGGLNRYGTVVLANVPTFTEDQIAAMKEYLHQGGGLIFYGGDNIDVDAQNTGLFAKHGILPSSWGDARGDAAQDDEFVELQKRDYEHPVTTLWNNPQYSSDLGKARTLRYHPLDEHAHSQATAPEEAGAVSVVLRFEKDLPEPDAEGEAESNSGTGSPAILERAWSNGVVYQIATTADTDWADLASRGASLILVQRMVGSVMARQDAGLNLDVGKPFIHALDPLQSDKEGFVVFAGRTNAATADKINEQPVLRFDDTHRAGTYTFQIKGEEGTETMFVVQHDETESDLRKIANKDIPLDSDSVITWRADEDFTATVQKARTGAELWLLILLGVLALVGLETYLAQKFSHSK